MPEFLAGELDESMARAILCMLAALFLLLWDWSASVPNREASGAGAALEVLRRGREVYAAQCAVCHGASGDGAGIAAHMFRVQPRDFRRDLFKFRSTPSGSLPSTIPPPIRSAAMSSRTTAPSACPVGSARPIARGRSNVLLLGAPNYVSVLSLMIVQARFHASP